MPTVPPSIKASPRGIQNTAAGFIIQNETIDESIVVEQIPDQNGAIADEQTYDHRFDLSFTAIGAGPSVTPPAPGATLEYGGKTYVIDKVSEAGTYNTVRKWTVTGHAYENYPAKA